jgi:hypothetical protein
VVYQFALIHALEGGFGGILLRLAFRVPPWTGVIPARDASARIAPATVPSLATTWTDAVLYPRHGALLSTLLHAQHPHVSADTSARIP